MLKRALLVACGVMCLSMQAANAQTAPAATAPAYDAELAKSLGGNDNGLRSYVLVILKTGPNKVTDADERKKMFQGHFANMERLAAEKKLAFAGPLDGVEGRRGIFILATPDIEVAKTYVATDPVIVNGEMVAEYHKLFGSAALMMVNDVHNKIIRKK
jgi:uncharacterized protein YciI